MDKYQPYSLQQDSPGSVAAMRNKVLRNTYWLLAISMLPTVLGAWIGLNSRYSALAAASPGMNIIFFLAVAFGLIFAIEKFKNSAIGVGLLLVFTFFMGVMLSRLIGFVMGFSNGPSLIMLAFGGTALIFSAMATIATVSKRDFSGLGRWLIVGVGVLFVVSLANIWLQLQPLVLTISAIAIVIFSALLIVDIQRVVNGGERNYITATLQIYLNLYNIFANLLTLLGIFGGNRN